MNPDTLVDAVDAALRAAADPVRAAKERAYLKSDLEHLGCGVPAVRAVVRRAVRTNGPLTHDELVQASGTLWNVSVHERRLAAVELLDVGRTLLSADDAPFLEALLRGARTWALVDPLAIAVVGDAVERDPGGWAATLDRWAGDPDFWLRRSALLALLRPLRAGGGDWERFARYADLMLDEREFFVRKAIGWVLRDTGRRRPELVTAWVLPRAHRASGVTLREALKPLAPEQQAAVRRAAATGSPR